MPYLTKDIVDRVVQSRAINLRESKSNTRNRIFLSHSHLDEDTVRKIVWILGSQGVDVYVDWLDDSMPGKTSAETARILKEKIAEYPRFLLLSTVNSAKSSWVPWELGVADELKGTTRIAIIPLCGGIYGDGSWAGREYFGLYPKVEQASAGVSAFSNPTLQISFPSGGTISFRQWLTDN